MEVYNKTYIYFICIVSAIGGLLFGYDWVVIGGAKPFYEIYFDIQNIPVMQAWCMSVALLGCLLGAISTSVLADKFGRKKMLILSAFIFLISSFFTGAATNIEYFIVARFIGGIAIGLAANLSPMYIAEIAPYQIRGRLVSLNQLAIVLGIVCAQAVNFLIAEPIVEDTHIINSWNVQEGWRWMFWAVCIPSAIFFLLGFLLPESPRWLAFNGNYAYAKRMLYKIGNIDYVNAEFTKYEKAESHKQHNVLKELFTQKLLNILLIGIVLAIFQQWSGTNIIFNYAQEIFHAAGYNLSDMLMNILVTGISFFIFTFIAFFTIEKIGRRTLMLIGSVGLSITYFLISICYFKDYQGSVVVGLVVMAIAFYAMSLGPVTWVLLSEIFPMKFRSIGLSICTFFLWVSSFLLTYTFPFLNKSLSTGGVFGVYSLICLLGFVFLLKKIPETKGKTLEELEKLL